MDLARAGKIEIPAMTGTRAAPDIIQQITDAFAEVEQPPREALFNGHCCECAETSEAYAGKRWMDVTLADVLRGRETALLTATAWRYYLPAFMIWAIREPAAVDVLQDNLVYQLEPPRDGAGVPEWFAERAVGFTEPQRQAICAYLMWYRDRVEIEWRSLGAESPRHVDNALEHWSRQ
jgi:hypothetical protein